MRNIVYKTLLCLSVAVLAVSCDLTRKPFSSMDKEGALETVSDAQKWSNNQMSSFRGRLMGDYDRCQDIQSDMLNASVDFGNRYGGFHNWNSLKAGEYELRDIYHSYYLSLKNINYFLSKVEKMEVTDKEKATMDAMVGQALFLRGYYYFNLAIRYGSRYNAATAKTDLCVPMVLEQDPFAKPGRASNEEVYAQIAKDLDKAATLLAANVGEAGADVITQDAVNALRARVALYKGDYENAYTIAKAIVTSQRYELGKTAEDLMNMWRKDTSSEDILRLFVSKPDEKPNVNSYYGPIVGEKDASGNPVKLYGPDWLPTQWVLDLYEDVDFRKAVYFEKVNLKYSSDIYEGLYVIAKFRGNPKFASVTDDPAFGIVPNSMIAPKAFRVAEMYLIAAEAGAEAGKGDAVKFLNDLRESRGLAKVALSGQDLIKEIRNERTRELAYEGFRLFDLRRWNEPLVRHNPQTLADGSYPFLSQVPDPKNMRIEANDNKFIWGLPSYEFQTNQNLKGQQNPGW